MSEMVERVARALWERHMDPDEPWATVDEFWRETYLEKARAAIEAMRQPTIEMLKAMVGVSYSATTPMMEDAFNAAINAALGDGQ